MRFAALVAGALPLFVCASCARLLGADDPILADGTAGDAGLLQDAAPTVDATLPAEAEPTDAMDATIAFDDVVATPPESSTEDAAPPPAQDAGPPPAGTRLVAGANLGLLPSTKRFFGMGMTPPAITADGYVPYFDGNDGFVKVVNVAPGSVPIPLFPATWQSVEGSPYSALAQGDALLLQVSPPDGGAALPLYTFSAKTGVTQLTPSTNLPSGDPAFALSTDGTRVVFWSENGTEATWSLRVMDIDGSNSVTLDPGERNLCGGGGFIAAFAGSRTDRVLAFFCPNGPGVLELYSLSSSAGDSQPPVTRLHLADAPWEFSFDSQGSFAATEYGAPPHTVSVYDLSTGAETVIETSNVAAGSSVAVANVSFFLGTGSSESLVYLTPVAYEQSNIAAPGPVQLLSGTYTESSALSAPSPDGAHALLSQAYQFPNNIDLSLVSTTQPGVTTLAGGATAGIAGDFWTASGSHALWLDLTTTAGIGVLDAIDVTDGGREVIDSAVWAEWSLSSSKIVAIAQAVSAGVSSRGNLVVYDLATTPPSQQLLESNVDGNVVPSVDKTQVVFTYSADPDPDSTRNGLWVVPVP